MKLISAPRRRGGVRNELCFPCSRTWHQARLIGAVERPARTDMDGKRMSVASSARERYVGSTNDVCDATGFSTKQLSLRTKINL